MTTGCQAFCGNGVLDEGEQCDSDALDGSTCETLGFVSGPLSCDSECQYVTSACEACGNGVLDEGEPCDGDDFGDASSSCGDVSVGGYGTLTCSDSCTLQAGGCAAVIGSAIISEIMVMPLLAPDFNDGEWLELHNADPTNSFGLGGCSIRSFAPFETFEIPGDPLIAPGGYATLGKGTLETLGFVPDIELPAQTTFLNGGDSVQLWCAGVLVDDVTYEDDGIWPEPEPGISFDLRADSLTAGANDAGTAWCSSTNQYEIGFFGTPGNPSACAP